MNEIISFMRDEPLVMTLCPEEESILLNKNVLDHLEQPRQVQILINEEQGMLLLKACSVEDREAVVIPQLPPDQLEVSGASLLKRIRRLMGWADNCPRQIMGFAIPEHYAIAFDLHSAVPVQLKPSGGGLPGRRS